MSSNSGPRDRIRVLGWVCIVGGVLLALALTAWTYRTVRTYEHLAVEGWRHPTEIEKVRAYWTAKAEDTRYWPGIVGGAAVSAFGVLLLAIRRPPASGPS